MIRNTRFALALIVSCIAGAACAPYPNDCDTQMETLAVQEIALADATVGVPYDEQIEDRFFASLEANEGEEVPPGLSIEQAESRHHLRGTPTTAGSYRFFVLGTDPSTQCPGHSSSMEISVDVLAAE